MLESNQEITDVTVEKILANEFDELDIDYCREKGFYKIDKGIYDVYQVTIYLAEEMPIMSSSFNFFIGEEKIMEWYGCTIDNKECITFKTFDPCFFKEHGDKPIGFRSPFGYSIVQSKFTLNGANVVD